METRLPSEDPTVPSSPAEAARKQQEVINRVLAGSIVTQLLQSGADEGQVIDFATEILNSVSSRGWNQGSPNDHAHPPEAREIVCRVQEESLCLQSEQVSLCPLRPEDHSLLCNWREQPHVQNTCSYKRLGDLLEGRDQDQERYDWILKDPAGTSIGLISLFHVHRGIRQAEMGKLIGDPAAQGHGYAHEATCLMLAYAFQHLGLQRIYLRTNGFNLHNIKLNEKIGFHFEGVLRASELLNQELIDVVLMSMLGHEFYQRYRVSGLPDLPSRPS